ncbi:MAG: hypothetical protein ACLS89_04895 [Collinsella sp.]
MTVLLRRTGARQVPFYAKRFWAENDVELVMEDGDLQDIADGRLFLHLWLLHVRHVGTHKDHE